MNKLKEVLALDQKFAGHTLLESVPFGNERLASRLVMAPMTRVFSPEGIPGENVAQYYRKRAENGIGSTKQAAKSFPNYGM